MLRVEIEARYVLRSRDGGLTWGAQNPLGSYRYAWVIASRRGSARGHVCKGRVHAV